MKIDFLMEQTMFSSPSRTHSSKRASERISIDNPLARNTCITAGVCTIPEQNQFSAWITESMEFSIFMAWRSFEGSYTPDQYSAMFLTCGCYIILSRPNR